MTKPRILIVDDEAFFRAFFAEVLGEGHSYQIDSVDSGQAALDYLNSQSVDIILADVMMPGISGLDLIQRVRKCDCPPDIILITADTSAERAIDALKSGARDYLLKPCNPEHLKHTVKSCLEQRQLLAENSLLQSQIQLYQRGQHLASQLNIDELVQDSLTAIDGTCSEAKALLYFASQNEFKSIASHDFTPDQATKLASILQPTTLSMTQPGFVDGKTVPDLTDQFTDFDSFWVFPMFGENKEHGALVLNFQNGVHGDPGCSLDNVTFLCEQMAIGFRNSCKLMDARELVYTDDLTGLFNHRYLHIALEQEINRSQRYGLVFSLAFIDLDLFKNINDEHGHMIGSDVLRQVADLLRSCVREADLLFRYGGDEFTALLVESDTRAAQIVSERIRVMIENHCFQTGENKTQKITATVGHATYPVHATSKEEIIELADQAMYLGKLNRNVSRSASEVNQP